MLKLKIKVGEIALDPFVDRDFIVPLFLVDDGDKICTVRDSIRVDASAVFDISLKACPHSSFEASKGIIESSGMGSITLRFRDVSMNNENKKIIVNFHALPGTNVPKEIGSGATPPLYIVRHRIVIEEENKSPYVWYKDEGGKEKCIELRVHMVDGDGNIVRNRKVPLKALLQYRNAGIVPQQSILSISPDTRLYIDEHYGECVIKFRVNEVSTRHQGQMFQLLVGPDLGQAPSTADVSSALCIPVDVKSKRNNHRDRSNVNVKLTSQLGLFGGMGSMGGLGTILDGTNGYDGLEQVQGAGVPMKRARSGEYIVC